MAFWSAILKAGESKKVDVAEMDIVLTIGNVALNNGAEGKAAKVFATVEDEDGPQKVLLATLRTPACEQAVLDITFPTDVTLSVEGSGEVHLAGIIAPADDGEEDDDAMYGGFPSDEEMGSGDEDEDGEEGSGDEEGSDIDSMENDPRVQELGSDESDEAPAAKPAPKLLTRKPEGDADAAAPKKQKVDNKKAADAKPKAAAKPAADASKEGVAGLSCAQCGKAFNAPAGLDQHMKAKHGAGGDAKPAAAEKPAPATPKAAAKPAAAATPKGATPKAAPKPAAAGTPKGAAGTPKGKK